MKLGQHFEFVHSDDKVGCIIFILEILFCQVG